jgi:uncharacterized membrane protein
MGGAHSHSSHDTHVGTARLPRLLLLGGLLAAAVATVIGLVVLWPSGDRPRVPYAAEGVSFPEATVVAAGKACPVIVVDPSNPSPGLPVRPEGCDELLVELDGGDRVTVQMPPGVADSGLRDGDTVELVRIPTQVEGQSATYSYFGTVRDRPLGLLFAAFVLVVGLVARLRGLLALVGLGFAGLVVWVFVLPALLDGSPGAGVAMTASAAIMFVVLYLAHGPSVRTSTALAGTLVGVGIAAAIGAAAISASRLSGLGDEAGSQVYTFASGLDFQGLLLCALIIAGLGVLNDVTITQSSAVWELRAAAPELDRRGLFARGMRIGRDHVASTIYTIVFAYAGGALGGLLLTSLYDRSLADLLTGEALGEEIVMTLAASMGLLLAMPVTTLIAVATVSGPGAPDGTSAAPR